MGEIVGHIDTGVLRFGAGGLIGLWPPNGHTWHFGQIFGPPPTLGHHQTV